MVAVFFTGLVIYRYPDGPRMASAFFAAMAMWNALTSIKSFVQAQMDELKKKSL